MKFYIVQIDSIHETDYIYTFCLLRSMYLIYQFTYVFFKKINWTPFSYFGACPVLYYRSYQVTGVAPVDPPISARGWSLRIYDQPK